MKLHLAIIPFAIVAGGIASAVSSPNGLDSVHFLDDEVENNRLKSLFEEWMTKFEKEYETTKEILDRFEIWTQNHFFIELHNQKTNPKPSYQLGHNQFSDMTWDEYKKYNKLGEYSPGVMKIGSSTSSTRSMDDVYFTSMLESELQRNMMDATYEIPSEMNWVTEGAIPPVKNQGMCGSCWAFSAVGAIEGKHFLDTGVLTGLSEQELLDCDPLDMGCGGGLMDNAFLFDENSTGICSEEDYPYVQHKRWWRGCASEKGLCDAVNHTRVKTFIDVVNTEEDMLQALAQQPVSVAIEADQQSFQFYKSGVYADPACGNKLDHGVLAVGYGTEMSDREDAEGIDYFLVRNSWGATWGDAGYIKMARKSETINGTCGILSFGSRPILRDDYD